MRALLVHLSADAVLVFIGGVILATSQYWPPPQTNDLTHTLATGNLVSAAVVGLIALATLIMFFICSSGCLPLNLTARVRSLALTSWYALTVAAHCLPVFILPGYMLTLPTIFTVMGLSMMLPLCSVATLDNYDIQISRIAATVLLCASIITPGPTNPFRYFASICVAGTFFLSPALDVLRESVMGSENSDIAKLEDTGRIQLALLHLTLPRVFVDLVMGRQNTTSVSTIAEPVVCCLKET